jgi:hypothetical protein
MDRHSFIGCRNNREPGGADHPEPPPSAGLRFRRQASVLGVGGLEGMTMNDDTFLFERCETQFPRDEYATYRVVGYRFGTTTALGTTDSFGAAERLRIYWQAQKMPTE